MEATNLPGPYKTATIDIDRASEFTGDDVDQYSSLVDLGRLSKRVLAFIPTITNSAVGIYVQRDPNKDTVPTKVVAFDDDATGHFDHATTAGTGGILAIFEVGLAQYIRFRCTSNQAADREIICCGID